MAQKNNDHLFDIAPEQMQQVGTQILDNNMPSNIDFDKNEKKSIEMVQMKPMNNSGKAQPAVNQIDFQSFTIKSYTIKGKPLINIQPQFTLGSIIPQALKTFSIKCFDEQYSSGFKKIWQSIVGYTYRQLYIHKGYIYLFSSQNNGLKVIKIYPMRNLFKVFIDLQDWKVRLVMKQDNSEQLVSRDYECKQVKDVVLRLNEEINSIGLKII